eukprot:maker-scaffold282_size228295-snap-gene-1.26 protein:Tk05528 transcript:maker-scaffold282_size228295-snap-gene-1.26-mRNA-1 annotation:"mediator of rna polymerase ii transcription subunit 30-like isoform x1"
MAQPGANQSPYGGSNANLMGPGGLMGGPMMSPGGGGPMMSPNSQAAPRGPAIRPTAMGLMPQRLGSPQPQYNMWAGSPQAGPAGLRPMGGPLPGAARPLMRAQGPLNRGSPGGYLGPDLNAYNAQPAANHMRLPPGGGGGLMGAPSPAGDYGTPSVGADGHMGPGSGLNAPTGDLMLAHSAGETELTAEGPQDSGHYGKGPPGGPNSNNPQRSTTPLSAPSPAPATTPNPQPGQGPGSGTAGSGPPPQGGNKEFNTATVCRIGQETVQEIVSRIQEVFSYLKSLQPPIGAPAQDRATLEKQQRLQEVLKGIALLYKRLHVCWDKVNEYTVAMEYTNVEALIPLRDEKNQQQRDLRADLDKKRGDPYRQALDEHTELAQQLTLKNRHLKEIIDQMRNIIWEINTMLAMRQN